jgi:hypothetical protein
MKLFFLPMLFALLFPVYANTQTVREAPQHECRTQISPEGAARYRQEIEPNFKKFLLRFQEDMAAGRMPLIHVPVQIHIVRRSDGTGGMSETAIWDEFENFVRPYYTAANLNFTFCNATNFINSDAYFNISGDAEGDAMSVEHNVADVLNIYYVNDPDGACGWARFTFDLPTDYIVIANSCADNQSTTAHEIGHYFDLFHTHETAFGTECPDGSNCDTAGDLLCDTPADPSLTSKVNNSCVYTGTNTACGGQSYTPDPTNIMSYSLKECRTFFSPEQIAKIAFTSLTGRSYLDYNCAPVNDLCSAALPLACGQTVTIDISNATATGNPNTSCGTSSNGNEPGVWYVLQGTGDVVTLSTCNGGTNYDTKIQVFTGSCGNFVCVTGNDDADCGNFRSEVEFCTEPGITYYIHLFGFGGDTGNAVLSAACATFPAPWVSSNIGSPGTGNNYDYSCDEIYTIQAGSANNSLPSDNLATIAQNMCGDFTLTVKIESVTSNGWAGLNARESSAAGSRMVGLYSNLGSMVRWESRMATNGNKAINMFSRPFPYWLRLVRQGNMFIGYYSANGVSYSLVNVQMIPLNACLNIGMSAFTYLPGQTATAVFSNVSAVSGVSLLVALPGNTVEPAGVDKQQARIKLFPNPARDLVTLEFPSPELLLGDINAAVTGSATLRLRNELGQLIEERRLDELPERLDWDIHTMNPGMYFIEVHAEGQLPQTLRFVKVQ